MGSQNLDKKIPMDNNADLRYQTPPPRRIDPSFVPPAPIKKKQSVASSSPNTNDEDPLYYFPTKLRVDISSMETLTSTSLDLTNTSPIVLTPWEHTAIDPLSWHSPFVPFKQPNK